MQPRRAHEARGLGPVVGEYEVDAIAAFGDDSGYGR